MKNELCIISPGVAMFNGHVYSWFKNGRVVSCAFEKNDNYKNGRLRHLPEKECMKYKNNRQIKRMERNEQ